MRFGDVHALGLRALPKPLPKMSPRLIAPTEAPGMFGSSNIGMPPPALRQFDLDLLVVELAGAQLAPERVARRRPRSSAPTSASSIRSSAASSALASMSLRLRCLTSAIADLDEIAHDLLDVAPDVADLGELGRLDLEERRAGELGEAARDLGLAAAGRARSSGCSSA